MKLKEFEKEIDKLIDRLHEKVVRGNLNADDLRFIAIKSYEMLVGEKR